MNAMNRLNTCELIIIFYKLWRTGEYKFEFYLIFFDKKQIYYKKE